MSRCVVSPQDYEKYFSTRTVGRIVPVNAEIPPDHVLITKWKPGSGAAQCFIHHTGQDGVVPSGVPVYEAILALKLRTACLEGTPVQLFYKTSLNGQVYITGVRS